MSIRHLLSAAVASVALGVPLGFSGLSAKTLQQAPAVNGQAQPAPSSEAVRALTARVTGVRGVVQVRENETAAWQAARAGMVLPVGAECRTGPRSAIEFAIADQKIILDRLGTVKILEALQGPNRIKTDIGMQYGRVQYKIEAAGSFEHDSTIRSPSSSLAVRGTNVVMIDDGILSQVTLLESQVRTPNVNDDTLTIGSGKGNHYGDRYVEMDETDVSPADHELEEAANPFIDLLVITPGELGAFKWNNNITSPTGVQEFRFYPYMTGASVSTDGPTTPPPPPPTTGQGSLTFNLTWVGNQASESGTPNLDLFVISPKGERLFPQDKGSTSVPSGGVISRNNRGGLNVTLGFENARWDKKYPLGEYTYGVVYRGKGDPANYRIIVVQNGEQINGTFDDTVTQFDRKVTFDIDVNAPRTQTKGNPPTGRSAATARPDSNAPAKTPPKQVSKPQKLATAIPAKAAQRSRR